MGTKRGAMGTKRTANASSFPDRLISLTTWVKRVWITLMEVTQLGSGNYSFQTLTASLWV